MPTESSIARTTSKREVAKPALNSSPASSFSAALRFVGDSVCDKAATIAELDILLANRQQQ